MTEKEDRIYLPAEEVHFDELFDWADPTQRREVKTATVRRLRRGSSGQSGALVEVNEIKVALFRHGENVYAINEKCPHAGGPLHIGDIEVLPDRSLCVRCPWHSWKWDLKTGRCRRPLGHSELSAPVYPTRVKKDGSVWVGFEEFSPKYFKDENF